MGSKAGKAALLNGQGGTSGAAFLARVLWLTSSLNTQCCRQRRVGRAARGSVRGALAKFKQCGACTRPAVQEGEHASRRELRPPGPQPRPHVVAVSLQQRGGVLNVEVLELCRRGMGGWSREGEAYRFERAGEGLSRQKDAVASPCHSLPAALRPPTHLQHRAGPAPHHRLHKLINDLQQECLQLCV